MFGIEPNNSLKQQKTEEGETEKKRQGHQQGGEPGIKNNKTPVPSPPKTKR